MCEVFIRKQHLLNYVKVSYVSEEELPLPVPVLIDCSYGTNPYGFSDRVTEERTTYKGNINDYPRYPYVSLRKALVEYWKDVGAVDINCIRIGCGSMGVLSLINKLLISEGTTVLGFAPQFTDYISDVRGMGGRYDYLSLKPEDNYRLNTRELLNQMDSRHHVVYIDNPNNPSGQVIPLDEIEMIVRKAQSLGVCVIVDEAYGDFIDKDKSAISLTAKYKNMFVTRSFSKGFGLAGARVGYMVCSEGLAPFCRNCDMAFAVSDESCRMAAAALEDMQFVGDSIIKVKASKRRLMKACSKLRIWETDVAVPIMVLEHPNKEVDLFKLFVDKGVLTEAGAGFLGMGTNAVRLRISADADALIKVIEELEREM